MFSRKDRTRNPRPTARVLALAVGICLLAKCLPAWAVGVVGGPVRTSGIQVSLGGESLIYGVQLGAPGPFQSVARITVQIDVGSVEGYLGPIASSDILALRLYADDGDAIFNPTLDTFMGAVGNVPLGTPIDLVDSTPSEPAIALGKWFWVSIAFNPSAFLKVFRVSAPVLNIETVPPPGPPGPQFTDGSIAIGSPIRVGAPSIPVGLEWLAGVMMLGSGVFWLSRRKREDGGRNAA